MSADVSDPRDQSPAEFLHWARREGVSEPTVRRLLSAVIGRGIHDPAVWGRMHQIPRPLGEHRLHARLDGRGVVGAGTTDGPCCRLGGVS